MPVSKNFIAYVLEQLTRIGGMESRRMFGGVGLYAGGLFFGLLDDDTLYLRWTTAIARITRRAAQNGFVRFRTSPSSR
jgi:DNA transformation protein